MAKILVIDDDQLICNTMSRIIKDMDHEVTCDATLKAGIKDAHAGDFDIIFLDVELPDGNGLEQLQTIQTAPSSPEVIVTTQFADRKGAETAIKNDAWDYIKKPLSTQSVTLAITRALQFRGKKNAGRTRVALSRNGIVGNSPRIKACLNLLARAASCAANVLIRGETGTGKELFARAIHHNSSRSGKNFVVIDCGALPKTLVESILFGYEKGAFTGAERSKEGLIKQADGGTLFLDEIGELQPSLQKTLLRVLQERRFLSVGGAREVESDFRLVSATSRDLDGLVKKGQFRGDLLYRLRTITTDLPPLRERSDDIRDLTFHYMKELCRKRKLTMKGFSPDFFEMIQSYSWPGNVRELFSTIESSLANALYEPTIFPKHLPTNIRVQLTQNSLERSGYYDDTFETGERYSSNGLPTWQDFRKAHIEEGEKHYLKELVARTNGDVKSASQLSGLSPPRLYELLRKYSISTRSIDSYRDFLTSKQRKQ